MCGLAAIIGSLGIDRTRTSFERMLQVQAHRGPDSSGSWYGTVQRVDVGLGFRPLKILDLSNAANQPMVSRDARFVLVFNGEIYNYLELRKELELCGVVFQTQGDTEVLMQALIAWGPAAFPRLNGMWAPVLLDRTSGEIMLSRDRFGVKPLHTYTDEGGLFVSSEIKAILEVAGRRFQVSESVVNAYLQQGLLCTGRATFFAGIEEFPPGYLARFKIEALVKNALSPSVIGPSQLNRRRMRVSANLLKRYVIRLLIL
jgi:asparagine synthase (glutamine-hydrolysing)